MKHYPRHRTLAYTLGLFLGEIGVFGFRRAIKNKAISGSYIKALRYERSQLDANKN